ncbi:MAG TPA: response regulator [Candidatus Angelobacter sp.]|nr:response regulator [Candidatus Angelobacter sp.]
MIISSTFIYSVSWPVHLDEYNPVLPPRAVETRGNTAQTTKNAKRILVIDDEVSIADSLTEILSGYGYDAVACYDGQAAIDAARGECPDVVISDVIMPGKNGVETALAIRELCPKIRVLLFSGQTATMNLLNQARLSGHEFEILPKPVHPTELLKKLSV